MSRVRRFSNDIVARCAAAGRMCLVWVPFSQGRFCDLRMLRLPSGEGHPHESIGTHTDGEGRLQGDTREAMRTGRTG